MSLPSQGGSNALILAPHGRDGAIAHELLRSVGIDSFICSNLSDFQGALDETACFAVVTEEALGPSELAAVAKRLEAQPSWSDLPFIVLTHHGSERERSPAAARLSSMLGNVTFIERPFHPTTFMSVAQTASKARQRQYEARARIEELHEGEERLRTALLAGHLGEWELDPHERALSASSMFKAIFGRDVTSPLSYDQLLDAVHSDDRKRVEEALATDEGLDELAIECRSVWADGGVHWAELRARRVGDRRRGSRIVGVAADITARKTAEDALRQTNELLEERVSLRTAELSRAHAAVLAEIEQRQRAEDLLRQSQKMEMIGQLTGGVAHDFNNLLMAVLGNLELLRKQVKDEPKSVRLVDSAIKGAQRGAALTQRLLAFARRQDLKVRPRSLRDLIQGMTNLIERSVGPQIEIRIDLPVALPPVSVDENQIELAVLNLAVNARDAMPAGGILTIGAAESDAAPMSELAPGRYVRLTVSDTGCGMDAETLARAVEPFFSTKEVGKGTGLGLSMVHGLAEQLRGALRLSSEVGRGTMAEIWLPASEAFAETEPQTVSQEGRADVGKASILVVDDDPLVASSTAGMLAALGHSVIEANSGEGAVNILNSGEKIDLLITDYLMPRMTGLQLARTAKEIRPDLAILLATGYADLSAGSDIKLPRISKPYLLPELQTEIAKALGCGQLGR
jgi:PAS domain S-box-containing protein